MLSTSRAHIMSAAARIETFSAKARELEVDDQPEDPFDCDPQLGINLRSIWRAYLNSLAPSYVPPLSILNNIKDDLQRSSEKRAIDEWRSIRHELDDQIEKAKDLAWDDLHPYQTNGLDTSGDSAYRSDD